MNYEIERKFLVINEDWRENVIGVDYYQGYIISDELKSVRIRVAGEKGFITIKGKSAADSISRPEFEYEIPKKEAFFF